MLRAGPRWGSYQRSPRTPDWILGQERKGNDKAKGERKEMGVKGKMR